ncbi:MAG TPA: DUF6268 family outer membrane beta-barrel protein [Chitinophaga sp.]|uniref:DUF6268 family outer membrane beta-barrel protein n=1 Tax=Chitinophaga sp. TaxID=1869181 RepID=UPI002CAD34CB|nr:DUF6268 family outer membrane beta-barrel protein [Chitinophaga sp.]HVI44171.1 DUF6268 family outer membrane beta-barrel protein [Chitinophaga sp.]
MQKKRFFFAGRLMRVCGAAGILFFVHTGGTLAQVRPVDLNVSMDYIPASRYIRPEDSVKTNATTTQARLNMGLSLLLSNQIDTVTGSVRTWTAYVGGSYTSLFNKDYDKKIYPSGLLTVDLGVQHYRSLRNQWGVVSFLSAGLYTDMEKITTNALFISGGAIFMKHFTRTFTFGFGATVTNSFGVPIIWPALYVQWQPENDRFRININVPDKGPGMAFRVGATYLINKQTDLTLAFKPRMQPYDVSYRTDDKRLVSFWQLPIGLENTWHVKKFDFSVEGGLMMLRSFAFTEKNISKMFSDNPGHKLSTNAYISAGIHYRFR